MNGALKFDCAAFYRERDQRTTQMIGVLPSTERPIVVRIDDAAARCSAGQLLLLALLNQLARVHRRIHVVLMDSTIPLALVLPFASDNSTPVKLNIDPCGAFSVAPLPVLRRSSAIRSASVRTTCDARLVPTRIAHSRASLMRRCLSSQASRRLRRATTTACLRRSRSQDSTRPSNKTALSQRGTSSGERGGAGPGDLSPVAVVAVLMVGAGAVGSALAFWRAMGVDSHGWDITRADIELQYQSRPALLAGRRWLASRRRAPQVRYQAARSGCHLILIGTMVDERAATRYDVLALANEQAFGRNCHAQRCVRGGNLIHMAESVASPCAGTTMTACSVARAR